jgi:pyruvyltransferase
MQKNISDNINKTQKRISNRIKIIIGNIRKNSIQVYWLSKPINFGDQIPPILLKFYGFTPIQTSLNNSEIVTIGSVLQDLDDQYSGYIFGAGLIEDKIKEFPIAKVLAVRGELTRERIGASKSVVLGDPGILVDRLLRKRQKKEYLLGIVPHYSDKNDERINKIYKSNLKEVLIIDVQKPPMDVITKIDKCEYILSSSLHGLIVADSLSIPNGWIELSDHVVGGGFKFYDYWSSQNASYKPIILTGNENTKNLISLTHPVSEKIEKIKNNLDNSFYLLRKYFL